MNECGCDQTSQRGRHKSGSVLQMESRWHKKLDNVYRAAMDGLSVRWLIGQWAKLLASLRAPDSSGGLCSRVDWKRNVNTHNNWANDSIDPSSDRNGRRERSLCMCQSEFKSHCFSNDWILACANSRQEFRIRS